MDKWSPSEGGMPLVGPIGPEIIVDPITKRPFVITQDSEFDFGVDLSQLDDVSVELRFENGILASVINQQTRKRQDDE